MKGRLHSVATAFAINVLPVPGGPYSKIPERLLFPKRLGYFKGNSIVSMKLFLSSRHQYSGCPSLLLSFVHYDYA
jgi:hypothetical protein